MLPILIATAEPLERKQFENILLLFVGAVFAGTLISTAVLTGIIHHEITDIRDIFIFHISHIRFALFTCLSVFIIVHLLWRHSEYGFLKKGILLLLAIWLVIFLAIMESVTGIAVLIIVAIILLLYYSTRKIKWWLRLLALSLALVLPAMAYVVVSDAVKEFYTNYEVDLNSLAKTTPYNHPYQKFTLRILHTENGYRIWIYICEPELKEEWNKRSAFLYDSVDMKGQPLRFTLIRYLTSRGLRKDADGVKTLTANDVHEIEHGVANVNYTGIYQLLKRAFTPKDYLREYNIYKEGGNPSGHSVMQRLNFWQAGWDIFKDHFWTGVGTGDLENAYQHEYDKLNSPLEEKYRLHAHNQYLAVGAALGIFGLLYFLLSLIYPMIKRKKRFLIFLYHFTFWITAVLSMVAEDTLETQAGVTFFAFFNSFYLFAYDPEK